MPAASSHPSKSTGHDTFPPSITTGGSPDVFINGKPAIRVGDSFAPHADHNGNVHSDSMSEGSSTVFINGQPACRIGDAAGPDALAEGSSDVFIGG